MQKCEHCGKERTGWAIGGRPNPGRWCNCELPAPGGSAVPTAVRITPESASLGIEGQAPGIRLSPLFEALLNSAGHLIEIHQPSAAVLIAQTAIEVCTERLVSKCLVKRDAAFLLDWIADRVQSYNVFRDDVKTLYKAVTEDESITAQPFWKKGRLSAHVVLRNAIAHRGSTATEEEARTSILVAREIINHMNTVAASRSLDLGD